MSFYSTTRGDPTLAAVPNPLSCHALIFSRFGFNNGKTMVDGLDGENTISHTWQSGDFATIVYQLRLLGFNAVRLPFLFNDLLARKPQVSGGRQGC